MTAKTLARSLLVAGAVATAVALPLAASSAPATRTVVTVAGRAQPAWFICDTLDAPMQVVVGPRTPQGLARITLFPKSMPDRPHGADYVVGDGDPGAGQVYYALSKGGRALGNLHAVNPGAFDADTPVVLPPLSSVELEGARAQCRLIPGAVLSGFTARRSVAVIRTKAGLAYQTFDFTSPNAHLPSADVKAGRELRNPVGSVLRFDKAGYRYEVAVPADPRTHATLSVFHGGRLLQREPFLAYSAAF